MRKMRKMRSKKKILIGTTLLALGICGLVIFGVGNKEKNNSQFNNVSEENKVIRDEEFKEKEKTQIKLTSVGNIIYHDKIIAGAKTEIGYDFSKNLEYVKNKLTNSDITIGLVEGTFAGGSPSGYPYFNAPNEAIDSLKNAGMDVINLASNHIVDKGEGGFKRTIETVKGKNIDLIGVRGNVQEKPYIIKEVKGHKIGIIAYTYETPRKGKSKTINSIPLPSGLNNLLNSFNYGNLDGFYDDLDKNIQDMKANGVEFIVTSLHWGEEYSTEENNTQKNIVQKLNEMGVDIILGGHPHVIQPFETIKNSQGKETFVTYAQGNFLSNQCYEELKNTNGVKDGNLTEDSYMIDFILEENEGGKLYLKKYEITPTWVYREPKGNGEFIHRVMPIEEVVKDREKYGIDEKGFERMTKSIERTKKILNMD